MKTILTVALILFVSSSYAQAKKTGLSEKEVANHPCFKQLERLCDHSDGPNCFKDSMKKLSPACQKEFGQTQDMGNEVQKHCLADFKRFCPINPDAYSKHGDKYLADYQKCIKANTDKFSPSCRGLMSGKNSGLKRIKAQTIR